MSSVALKTPTFVTSVTVDGHMLPVPIGKPGRARRDLYGRNAPNNDCVGIAFDRLFDFAVDCGESNREQSIWSGETISATKAIFAGKENGGADQPLPHLSSLY
jgi:hypothetical protein